MGLFLARWEAIKHGSSDDAVELSKEAQVFCNGKQQCVMEHIGEICGLSLSQTSGSEIVEGTKEDVYEMMFELFPSFRLTIFPLMSCNHSELQL